MGIEPTLSAWEAEVLPLNYTRGNVGILTRLYCQIEVSALLIETLTFSAVRRWTQYGARLQRGSVTRRCARRFCQLPVDCGAPLQIWRSVLRKLARICQAQVVRKGIKTTISCTISQKCRHVCTELRGAGHIGEQPGHADHRKAELRVFNAGQQRD